MINQDLEYILHRIISGKTYFNFNKERYCLKAPSLDVKQRALEIYFDIVSEEKFAGWLRESNLDNILISLGYWDFGTKEKIKDLEKKIEKLKIDLYKNRLNSKLIKSIRSNIKNTYKELNKILAHKTDLYQNTLEGYANSIKNEYILCHSLYKNNKLVFKFNDNSSYIYFNSLIAASNEHSIDMQEIKKLARDGSWRSIWSCNKDNPFGVPGSVHLHDDQRALINLSIMYDSVYDHPECPEDFVIEDDDMLDGWMLFQKEKNRKEKAQSSQTVSSVHKNAQEVFIMANSKEDLENISDLNDDYNKMIIKSRVEAIKKKGSVSHFDMPDVIDEATKEMNARLNRK